jgi:hypothetical protein
MRSLKVLVLMALVLPLCAAMQARADGSGGSGTSQKGDDLTVCCQAVFTPPTAAPTVPPLFQPQAVGCSAIGGDAKSINGCSGVVLGCDEGAFICEPSATVAGTKDCLCAQFGQISAPPPPAMD